MPFVFYDSFKLRQHNGNAINFSSDTIKLSLHTVSYVPNRATHQFKSDLTNEVSGTGYTAGGATLASKTLTVTANVLTFDCADVTFSQNAAGFSNARIAVVYKDTGVAGTSALVAYHDLGSDKGNVSGDLVLQTPNGIFTQ